MKTVTIFPPKMEAIGQALDIFGENRVSTGEWNEPVIIKGLTQDEVAFARKFFGELGFTVELQEQTANDSVQELIGSSQPTVCA